ncbi:hypothetical protein FSARC_6597 [Fusarium sarcochroum]|uniref:Uncharacterized protein n=1 Tax=Fusarium sarcochroum TaxID=1208366 RepID=A0A8H4TWT6_9HYPO|nr:hypothetical protein FSARC_6597 [Fusarium sarcochroum]
MLRGAQLDSSRHSTRIVLIGCLLFVTIEHLQKRYSQAQLHLRNGLHILACQKSRGLLQSSGDSADHWLTEAFSRLDLQTELLLYNTEEKDLSLYEQQVSGRGGLASLGSLDEARSWVDFLMSQAFQLQRESYSAENSEDVAQLFRLSSKKRQLQQDLTSWLQAFRAFKPQPPSDPKGQVAYGLLLAYHEMTVIITGTSLSLQDEFLFDQFTSNFTSIITSCRIIIAAARALATDHNSTFNHKTHLGFSTDMGIIRPLYYTALKCRVGDVRREALSMLHSQTHQEGIWDAPTASLVASEVVHLEENGFGEKDGKDGPESVQYEHQSSDQCSRISDAWVELPSSPESELRLTVRQRSRNGTWTIGHRAYNGICWM